MSIIEWTEQTWNPITGCNKVSPGCANCYAEGIAKRFWGDRKFSDVQFHPKRLGQPLKRKKSTMYFVNSMSDLFHEAVTFQQKLEIFSVISRTPQHTYQVLTKRPERMMNFMSDYIASFGPLPNLWLGVTVENQRTADERVPLLLQTPADVRFLSCEPLLEEIDLTGAFAEIDGNGEPWAPRCNPDGSNAIDWVIVGGESGPKSRPCDIAWIRSIVEQCKEAEVACFVKQLGSKPVETVTEGLQWDWGPTTGKANNPDEWPQDLRVREFPRSRTVATV